MRSDGFLKTLPLCYNLNTYMKRKLFAILVLSAFALPGISSAAAIPVSAWIPYWKDEAGIKEISKNLKPLWRANPFSYEVQVDGTLVDLWGADEILWQDFWLDAKAAKVKMVPTIAWHNGDQIYAVLSSSTARGEHINGIIGHVNAYNFDGVDINYENKLAESHDDFAKFLAELSAKLKPKKKILSCTIEARMPLTSRFKVIPPDIKYANDYVAINKYCDEVHVMAYDQRNADILLNEQKGKGMLPYLPVADKDWVEKVIQETTKTISPSKIWLGVATFGYEHEMALGKSDKGLTVEGYNRVRSITYKDFDELVKSTGMKPFRNSAGELSLMYIKDGAIRIAWISDSKAVADKVALAKKYKLKGVSVFSENGENDPNLWSVLK